MNGWAVVSIVPPLVLLEGFFSGSEIALLSADRLRLKEAADRGSRGAKLALRLTAQPERVLSTTLFVTSLAVIAISTLIAVYVLSRGVRHADLIAVAITSPLVVLFGELLPKTVYQRSADRIAPWVAFPVNAAWWVFYPFTRLLSAYTHRLSRLVGPIEELLTGRRRSTREEIRALLSYGKRETEIKSAERRMIKRIFDFKDTEAQHALIPLVRVEAIDAGSNVRDALHRFQRHRHSRMPVFEGRIDNIVGVLESADLFTAGNLDAPIRGFVTSAHYVAETQALEDVMRVMRSDDIALVVVVDEYGGAVGILTFEDIIEEIVGEIEDEYDTESHDFKPAGDDAWVVQARMAVQAINEKLGLDLPEGDYETLGGFLLQQFGRIPEVRDELHFNTPGGALRFVVRKATERRVETVLVERLTPPSRSED